jgi:hypothetical protein
MPNFLVAHAFVRDMKFYIEHAWAETAAGARNKCYWSE